MDSHGWRFMACRAFFVVKDSNAQQTNTTITKLNLQELSLNKFVNNLEIDNYKLLNELIECNKTINTLEFEEVIFLDTEFKKFIQHLYFNKTIINLKLNTIYLKSENNNINVNNELAELIKNNDTLQNLEINILPSKKSISCSIDPKLIVNNLKENKTLKLLVYGKNILIKDEDINIIQKYNKNITIIKIK